MINPSDMTPDLPNLHSLTLEATPTYSSSSVAPHPPVRLPYVHTDQWLTKSIVAAAYQQFLEDLPLVGDASQFTRTAFEHLVQAVSAAYSAASTAASTAAGVAEAIGKERMSGLEKLHESHIKLLGVEHRAAIDTLKVKHNAAIVTLRAEHTTTNDTLRAEHKTTINTLRAEHTTTNDTLRAEHKTTINTLRAEHTTTIDTLKVKHNAAVDSLTLKHDVAIQALTVKLDHTTEMFNFKLSSAENRVAVLKQEMSLARHRHIQSTILSTSVVQGSINRRRTWKTAIAAGLDNQPLPVPTLEGRISDHDVAVFLGTSWKDEPRMYTPVTEFFGQLLNRPRTDTDPGVKVFDTHHRSILSPYKPDICVCVGGTETPEPEGIYVAIELKHITATIDDEDRGQVLDYLVAMHTRQSSRSVVAGLLSNLKINHVVLLRALEGGGTLLVHHSTVSLAEALTFIKQVVLVETPYCPPLSAFPAHLGSIERRLGNPRSSTVAEFKMSAEILASIKSRWPSEVKVLGNRMAVKVILNRTVAARPTEESSHRPVHTKITQANEISIYKQIQRWLAPSRDIARLVYHSSDLYELGIAPVGESIDLRSISSHNTLLTILNDVLNGIKWLHDCSILHRDIRRDNVIVVTAGEELHGKIIDFGTAITLGPHDEIYPMQEYLGGYICCPRELIGDFTRLYWPKPAHDYLAWVMMVNFLVFPNGVPYLHSCRVAFDSIEAEKLEAFWVGLETSVGWSKLVAAAKASDTQEMARLVEGLIFML